MVIVVMFKRKSVPYSQEEIAEQISHVAKLITIRDRAHEKEAVTRAITAIECAQEILNFMLMEVRDGNNK